MSGYIRGVRGICLEGMFAVVVEILCTDCVVLQLPQCSLCQSVSLSPSPSPQHCNKIVVVELIVLKD